MGPTSLSHAVYNVAVTLPQVRTGGKDDQVRKVTLQRYQKVSPSVFGLTGKKKVVVLRTSGAIVGESCSKVLIFKGPLTLSLTVDTLTLFLVIS